MLLNFGLPTGKPTVTVAPESNIDINAILGLTPSQYTGLQNVRDTGYFYGNNKMYEKYTPPPSTNYGFAGFMGGRPAYYTSNILGGAPRVLSEPSYETLKIGDQNFRTVDADVEGFRKTKTEEPKADVYSYRPSMAYIYSNMPRQTYTPQQLNNVTSFLTAPIAPANTYTGNHGVGRFLNAGSLLPAIDYSAPQTVSSSS